MGFDLLLVALSSAATSAWHHFHFRHREIRNHRQMCNHVWGDTAEVMGRGPRSVGEFFIRWCVACGEQMHCNADGSKYVPLRERPKD